MASLDRPTFAMPGFRPVLQVEPGKGSVRAMLEDDLHAMMVRIEHDGANVTSVTAVMDRAPWTTCPGAEDVLRTTFTGIRLAQVTAKREKQANCTHLHDLAVLAACHAGDDAPIEYAIAITDPREGERILEIVMNGTMMYRWIEQDGILTAPEDVSGQSLLTLRAWIAGLAGDVQEAARMLQWAGLVAHSRPLSDAEKHAFLFHRPSCFTMQPAVVGQARANAPAVDFSSSIRQPLTRMRERLGANHQ